MWELGMGAAIAVALAAMWLIRAQRRRAAMRRALLEGFRAARPGLAGIADSAAVERRGLAYSARARALRLLDMPLRAQWQEGCALAAAWRVGALAGCHPADASDDDILNAHAATRPFRDMHDEAERSGKPTVAQLRQIAMPDAPDLPG